MFLRWRSAPTRQVGNQLDHSGMGLFESNGLQLFKSRCILQGKLEPVCFERSKIGSNKQFRFRRSKSSRFGEVRFHHR